MALAPASRCCLDFRLDVAGGGVQCAGVRDSPLSRTSTCPFDAMEPAEFVRCQAKDLAEMTPEVRGIAEAKGLGQVLKGGSRSQEAFRDRFASCMHAGASRRQAVEVAVAFAESLDAHPSGRRGRGHIEWSGDLRPDAGMSGRQAGGIGNRVAAKREDRAMEPPLRFPRIVDPVMFHIGDESAQGTDAGARRSTDRLLPVEDALDFEQLHEWPTRVEEGFLPALARPWAVFVAQAGEKQDDRSRLDCFRQSLAVAVDPSPAFEDEESMHSEIATMRPPPMRGKFAGPSTMQGQVFAEQAASGKAGPGISGVRHAHQITKTFRYGQ